VCVLVYYSFRRELFPLWTRHTVAPLNTNKETLFQLTCSEMCDFMNSLFLAAAIIMHRTSVNIFKTHGSYLSLTLLNWNTESSPCLNVRNRFYIFFPGTLVTLFVLSNFLWSSGQRFWRQIQRSRIRFSALPDFLRSSGSGTGSTQPREYNWRAT
jgi:hypothetical protein